jgi:hypothetical protein
MFDVIMERGQDQAGPGRARRAGSPKPARPEPAYL